MTGVYDTVPTEDPNEFFPHHVGNGFQFFSFFLLSLKNAPPSSKVTSDTGDELSYRNLHIQDVTFQQGPTTVETHRILVGRGGKNQSIGSETHHVCDHIKSEPTVDLHPLSQ